MGHQSTVIHLDFTWDLFNILTQEERAEDEYNEMGEPTHPPDIEVTPQEIAEPVLPQLPVHEASSDPFDYVDQKVNVCENIREIENSLLSCLS